MKKFLQRVYNAVTTDLTDLLNLLTNRTMQTVFIAIIVIHCFYCAYVFYKQEITSITENEKTYCGVITGKQESTSKYNVHYYVGFKPYLTGKQIELGVTPITYSNIRIGENICFDLKESEVFPEKRDKGLIMIFYGFETIVAFILIVAALVSYIFIPFFSKD